MISAEYAKSSAAVGASVTVNQIDHTVAANIKKCIKFCNKKIAQYLSKDILMKII